MDTINDPVVGDAMNEDTCRFWCDAVRKKHVIAWGGPPCESWSYARGKHLQHEPEQTTTGPRVISYDSVNLRELRQLITGNALLCFALLIIVEIICVAGFAVLEHLAEPLHDPSAASI